jgi:hypothetical protein
MQDHSAQIKGLLVAALLIFAVYRRLRRSFGRQRLRPVSMQVRMGLMLVIGGLLASTARLGPPYVEAIAAGLLAGIALAIWGASQTRFEREGAELYYVPHTYTGIAVSMLFVGRLAYRFVLGYGQTSGQTTLAGTLNSPLTVGLFFVLVGYYVCYYSLVLRSSRGIRAELSAPAGSGPPSTGEPSKPA